jgi:hypothetical protein
VLADFFFVRTDGELQVHVVGNDVVFRSTVNGTNGYNGGIERGLFAADDCLDGHNEFGREHDGIFADFGAGAMGAATADSDIDGGGAGECVTGCVGDFSGFEFGAVVQSESVVWPGDARVEPVGEHGARAVDGFLRGLADQHQSSVPLIFRGREQLRGTDQRGDVDIVSAGMHYAYVQAGVILGVNVAGVGQTGLFFDGQRVHIGAN